VKTRKFLKNAVAVCAVSLGSLWGIATAQVSEVKIGLIAPLSGPYARQGDFMLKGAELAVQHINEFGGIKSLNGAKIKLISADAGESTEKAKNAAQRLIADNPDMVGMTGAWLSSYTLAVSEVTERAGIPLVTVSFADSVTERGFQYLFQTSVPASVMAREAMPAIMSVAKASGGAVPKTVAAVMDNTASPLGFMKGMRGDSALEKLGLEMKLEEIYTPPLADATSIVQKIRSARPQLLLLVPSNLPDNKLILERMTEVGLTGGKLPIVMNGAHMGSPDLLKVLKKEQIEGAFVVVANWQAKGQEKLVSDFMKKTGEPWMPQDAVSTYGDMWFFKEALEETGSVDKATLAKAMRNLKNIGDVSRYYAGNTLQFDASGKRLGAKVMILQWQDGQPKLVYPADVAVAKARWPKQW